MKTWRIVTSILLGFLFSFSMGAGYLNLFQYTSWVDRTFLILIPAIAFAFAIHHWPAFRERMSNASFDFKAPNISEGIVQNRNGLFLAVFAFVLYFILAKTFNHPALNYNTVFFESDAGPWLNILASPEGDDINRAVHPLMLITIRPLIRLFAFISGGHWQIAAFGMVAFMSAACVFMLWLFIKRATQNGVYASLFACIFTASASQLIFGSLTDTYVFGTATLLLFLLLVQSKEEDLSLLSASGVLVFGVTVTNIVQSIIFLLSNRYPVRQIVKFSLLTLGTAVILTSATGIIHPNRQTLFFVPQDIAVERGFVKPLDESSPARALILKSRVMARTLLLYGVVGPEAIADISNKKTDPYPTIDIKTFNIRDGKLASYKGLANIPLAAWLILLTGALFLFFKNNIKSTHFNLMLGLLGSLAFNFILHLNYGSELFLYTSYWVYALILFTALACAELAGKKWFQISLAIFIVILSINNANFIYKILQAVEPFFASAPV